MPSLRALLIPLLAVLAIAQQPPEEGRRRDKPADLAELSQIADRGRRLAGYDVAAWHATDAVQELHPPAGVVGLYLGRETKDGWVVGFGHLNPEKSQFLLAFEVNTGPFGEHPNVKRNEPALQDYGWWLHQALAFETVKKSFSANRPYNLAVVPTAQDRWYVYAYPAQTINGTFPSGGDFRYTVSPDGNTILETHHMHSSVLEFKGDFKDKTANTFRTEFLDDAPEDTDVATVIMMGHVPMIVATTKFVYKIADDGTPSYMMGTEAFMKTLKNKP